MNHCTYVYKDPRNGVPVYVGKGVYKSPTRNRAISHISAKSTKKLPNFIRARMAEGYVVVPEIILCETDDQAKEMEMLLIAMIGRENIGTGTLFNLTDGGEGNVGIVYTPEQLKAKSDAQLRRYSNPEALKITSEAQRKRYANKVGKTAAKPCTIDDGHTIFHSRRVMGESRKDGARSPNFRYLTEEETAVWQNSLLNSL